MTNEEVLAQLEGRQFSTYRDLQEAVVSLFNQNLSRFPSGYTYRHVLEAAIKNNWIVRDTETQQFQVRVKAPIFA